MPYKVRKKPLRWSTIMFGIVGGAYLFHESNWSDYFCSRIASDNRHRRFSGFFSPQTLTEPIRRIWYMFFILCYLPRVATRVLILLFLWILIAIILTLPERQLRVKYLVGNVSTDERRIKLGSFRTRINTLLHYTTVPFLIIIV